MGVLTPSQGALHRPPEVSALLLVTWENGNSQVHGRSINSGDQGPRAPPLLARDTLWPLYLLETLAFRSGMTRRPYVWGHREVALGSLLGLVAPGSLWEVWGNSAG